MSLLIAPHQFPHLDKEKQLALDFGLEIIVAKDQEQFAAAMPQAKVVMVTPYAKVTEQEIELMSQCLGIVRYGIGYDNIDVKAAVSANIPVSIVPDASTEEVASHALTLGLSLLRRIPAGQKAIASYKWASEVPADLPVLSKAKVGVVGMGRIGRIVAKYWSALGAEVKAYDPFAEIDPAQKSSVEEILSTSDLVTLHVPLNEETKHMISEKSIASMKNGAIVVNVSRGGLIDENALAQALVSGKLAGAGVDVFEKEPLGENSPLREAPNAILTPHSAWKSKYSLEALQSGAVERARALLNGEEPKDLVFS